MRDPISCVKHFVESLATNPTYTAKTTASGIAHIGEMDGVRKATTPLLGIAGIGLVFSGAATGNPLSVGLGGFAATHSAALFFEHGEEVASQSMRNSRALCQRLRARFTIEVARVTQKEHTPRPAHDPRREAARGKCHVASAGA